MPKSALIPVIAMVCSVSSCDPLLAGGTFYALVGLDLQAFKNTVSAMQQLDEGVRKAVLERSDSAFERMDQAFDQSKWPAPSDPPFTE
jgi:hypothetical protein